MRILAIQPKLPFGTISGGEIRNAAILQALSECGALSTIAFRSNAEAHPPMWANVAVPTPEAASSIWQTSLFQPLSHRLATSEKAFIKSQLKTFNPDVVVVEGVLLKEAVQLASQAGVPVVLDMHNVESTLLPELFSQRKMRYWPGNYWRELVRRFLAPFEDRSAARMATQIWVCSERDETRLKKLAGLPASVVPNPISNSNFFEIPIEPSRYSSANLIFVGQLLYAPNVHAIKVLCRDIVPSLPVGGFLQIAGMEASTDLREIINKAGVELIDSPPDLAPYLARSGYCIMPLDHGGGTRIKAIEALSAGVIVIATDKAVESLGLVDGVHYLAAQTPAESLRCLEACLKNPAATAKIAEQGREFVRQTYGADALKRTIKAALGRIPINDSKNEAETPIISGQLQSENGGGTQSIVPSYHVETALPIETSDPNLRGEILKLLERYYEKGNRGEDTLIPAEKLSFRKSLEFSIDYMLAHPQMHDEDFTVFRKFNNEFDLILDIGANAGYSAGSIWASGAKSKVTSFEPVPIYHKGLEKLRCAQTGAFDFRKIGIADCAQKVKLVVPAVNREPIYALASGNPTPDKDRLAEDILNHVLQHTPFKTIRSLGLVEIEIQTDSLDNQVDKGVSRYRWDNIVAIKIDVEGMEYKVLSGAVQTLEKYTPLIMLEGGNRWNNLPELMDTLGYRYAEREGEKLVFQNKETDALNGFYVHQDRIAEYRDMEILT